MKQWPKILIDQKNHTCSWPIEDYGVANGKNHYTGKKSVISSDYHQLHRFLLMTLYNSLHF